jgi:hypothetical protein
MFGHTLFRRWRPPLFVFRKVEAPFNVHDALSNTDLAIALLDTPGIFEDDVQCIFRLKISAVGKNFRAGTVLLRFTFAPLLNLQFLFRSYWRSPVLVEIRFA